MLGHRIHVYTNVSIFLIHAGIFFLKTVCLPDTHTHTHWKCMYACFKKKYKDPHLLYKQNQ